MIHARRESDTIAGRVANRPGHHGVSAPWSIAASAPHTGTAREVYSKPSDFSRRIARVAVSRPATVTHVQKFIEPGSQGAISARRGKVPRRRAVEGRRDGKEHGGRDFWGRFGRDRSPGAGAHSRRGSA